MNVIGKGVAVGPRSDGIIGTWYLCDVRSGMRLAFVVDMRLVGQHNLMTRYQRHESW